VFSRALSVRLYCVVKADDMGAASVFSLKSDKGLVADDVSKPV